MKLHSPMFNFSKKPSNVVADIDEHTGMAEKYNAAIRRIEELEEELDKKTAELAQSNKAQQIMSDGVKKCVASLYTVQSQLQGVVTHLEISNKHIADLKQRNKILKLSGDQWFKRAIKLEFEVLTTKEVLKRLENERDIALKSLERLQAEHFPAIKNNTSDKKLN
ncbi:MAG: hypothetical protein ACXWF8_08480 [Methylobacter sp.]